MTSLFIRVFCGGNVEYCARKSEHGCVANVIEFAAALDSAAKGVSVPTPVAGIRPKETLINPVFRHSREGGTKAW